MCEAKPLCCPLYVKLACLVRAYRHCVKRGIPAANDHEEAIERLVKERLPSGSGFDAGCALDLEASTPSCLVIRTSYHHMNDDGYYDGWTDHTVKVRAVLDWGMDLSVSGKDRNQIKEYIGDVFHADLSKEVPRW